MADPFKLGDIVAFRAAFLRSISDYSHASASRRGAVIDLHPIAPGVDLVVIDGAQWAGDPGAYCRVLSTNLVRADRIHLEPV